jgi:hypothetical protein
MIVSKSNAGTSVQDDRYIPPATPVRPQGRAPFKLPAGYVYSDWTPWPPPKWRPIVDEPVTRCPSDDDDLSIPDFLKR